MKNESQTNGGVKVVGQIDLSIFDNKKKISPKKEEDATPALIVPKKGTGVELKSGRKGEVTGYHRINGILHVILDNETSLVDDSSLDQIVSNFSITKIVRKETIHFFLDRKKKIIGRLESGKVAIINLAYKGTWVKDNEDWEVKIDKEFESKVIVTPLQKVSSQEDNEKLLSEKVQGMKDKDWNKSLNHSYSPNPSRDKNLRPYFLNGKLIGR